MDDSLVFAHAVARPDAEIDLAAAALLIAEREYPGLDVARYLARLAEIAARARARGGGAAGVSAVLFEELGLRGNTGAYYDARNSFLNQVLDRGLGIPITLSVIFMEVGWRLGLAVEGIGYPGHFLVRAEGRILDCFQRGAEVDAASLTLAPLTAISKRAILTRMLVNLSRIDPPRPWLREMLEALEAPRREPAPPS